MRRILFTTSPGYFPPPFGLPLTVSSTYMRMRVDERKALLTCSLKFMKWESVMVLQTLHQQYSRFRIRQFKSHTVYDASQWESNFPTSFHATNQLNSYWLFIVYLDLSCILQLEQNTKQNKKLWSIYFNE